MIMKALMIPLEYGCPAKIFARWQSLPWSILLESVPTEQAISPQSQYSFIAIDPFLKFEFRNNQIYLNEVLQSEKDPLILLKNLIKNYPLSLTPNLPPFQGGLAGFFSYEFGAYLMNFNPLPVIEKNIPLIALGFYDLVIAFDHLQKKCYLFSSGYSENASCSIHAQNRANWVLNKLNADSGNFNDIPQFSAQKIVSNFTQESYRSAIKKLIHYIKEGDIFEANLAQRFSSSLPKELTPYELYLLLRLHNPKPFAAFLNFITFQLVSSSPERFLKLENGHVEARPIKGTIERGKNIEEDLVLANTLLQCEKNRAENIMIVDLMRNDLSKVCEIDSVDVPQLCGLESFPTVHHLVSVITAKLKDKIDALDLLAASFPAGSITGAPKIRAMEIISELEPHPRGPYCGCIGYIGFDGGMDLSIIIRTFVVQGTELSFHAGGAIVLDSDPQKEYEETLQKALALKKILTEL